MLRSVWGYCTGRIAAAKNSGLLGWDEAAWHIDPRTGTQIEIWSGSDRIFISEVPNDGTGEFAKETWWAKSDDATGQWNAAKPFAQALPGELVQRLERMLFLPRHGSLYGHRDENGTIAALTNVSLLDEIEAPHRRFVTVARYELLFGERLPSLMTTVEGHPSFLNPERWWKDVLNRRIVPLDRLIAHSTNARWRGPEDGERAFILIGDGWTGVNGPALYIHDARNTDRPMTLRRAQELGGTDMAQVFRQALARRG
jgi:hypothetical protein